MTDAVNWLNWWRAGFVTDIHTSWDSLPWFTLSVEEQKILYQDSPSAVRALCQISSTRLPMPEERVLRFVDLSPMRQQAMLRLIAALCNADFHHLSDLDQEWCERIVRGIRPQSFLPTGIDYRDPVYHLSLIKMIFLPSVWSRLRLRFTRDVIIEAEQNGLTDSGINLKRFRAMFDASLWRMEKR